MSSDFDVDTVLPKVLVLSNNCFSKMSSNGRTLGNFFVGWSKEHIAQFYLSGEPDDFFCNQYFQVSDRQALNAVLRKDNIGGAVNAMDKDIEASAAMHPHNNEKKHARNAVSMLLREMVWMSGAWENSGYWKWVEGFSPNIVLLQAGDCAFMYRAAVKTAERTGAKLVIYNSESYYYKDYDYFRGNGIAHMVYPLFRKQLKKAIENAYAVSSGSVYICDELREQYSKDFPVRSETIFTSSDFRYQAKTSKNRRFTAIYCGNLGLKRHESLIDIGEALQNISDELYVDVYGKTYDEEVEESLKKCKGIRYHGFVSYEKVEQLLHNSDLILHVESFDSFYQEDIKFGFSTKLADCLSSGNCFLLYAPKHFASYQYLEKNEAAYTISNKDDLRTVLEMLVDYPDTRSRYRDAALKLAEKNHRLDKNIKKFQAFLSDISKEAK